MRPAEAPLRGCARRLLRSPVVLLLLAVVALEAVLWPSAVTIQDETIHLTTAVLLTRATIFADEAGVSLFAGVAAGGHLVPQYPPGLAALMSPLVEVHWRLAYVVPLTAHLLGGVLFAVLLRRVGVRPVWALLYLLHPALLLFSRTLMTDGPSATVTVGVLLLLLRGRHGALPAGALLGASLFLRYANVLTFGCLLLALAARDLWELRGGRRSLRELATSSSPRLLLGFAGPAAVFVGYNLAVYGALTPPSYGDVAQFAASYVPANLPGYAVGLLVLYPLMLLAPLAYRCPLRLEVLAVSYCVLLCFSAYFSRGALTGGATGLVVGLRLLLPVLPLFLLAYAAVLDRGVTALAARRPVVRTAVPAAAAALGLLTSVVLSMAHQARLDDAATVRELVEDVLPPGAPVAANGESVKFLNAAWGAPAYALYGSQGTSVTTPVRAVVFTAQEADLADPSGGHGTALGADVRRDLADARSLAMANGLTLRLDRSERWRVLVWLPPQG